MGKYKNILYIIFVLSLLLRLYVAFITPNYDYEGYYAIGQAENIAEDGKPLMHSALNDEERMHTFSPLFYYILAFFRLFLPAFIVYKVLPNIFASSLVFIIFIIAYHLTKDEKISLIASFISAFTPIYFSETVNSVSVYSLFLPLMFYAIYLFFNIKKKRNPYYFVFILLILSLMHPSVLIIVLSFIFYTVILKLENIMVEKEEIEIMIFSIFFILWIQFLIYKNDFLLYGSDLIWQNIPVQILSDHFSRISILSAILGIGIIPLFAGVYLVYKFLFKAKDKNIYLIISFVLGITLLLYLKLIELKSGLIFLGIILSLLFSKTFKYMDVYLERTRFYKYKVYVSYIVVSLFIITTVAPLLMINLQRDVSGPSDKEIEAFLWLKNNSDKGSVVAAGLDYGFIIETVSMRKNVIDPDFLSYYDSNKRLDAVDVMYESNYKINAVKELNIYGADYLFVSNRLRSKYDAKEISYLEDEACFDKVYDNGEAQIYNVMCEVEER